MLTWFGERSPGRAGQGAEGCSGAGGEKPGLVRSLRARVFGEAGVRSWRGEESGPALPGSGEPRREGARAVRRGPAQPARSFRGVVSSQRRPGPGLWDSDCSGP